MISVRFRVPYPTIWGQSLAVVGTGPELGDWDPARGVKMACRAPHAPAASPLFSASSSNGNENAGDGTPSTVAADPPPQQQQQHQQQQQPQQQPQQPRSPPPVPVWEAQVELPSGSSVVHYKYLLLSEDGGVARREATARTVALPTTAATTPKLANDGGPSSSAAALLCDSWLDDAEPGALLGRSAFVDAISPPPGPPRRGGGGEGGGINPSLSSSAPSLLDAAAAAAAAGDGGGGGGGETSDLPSSPSSQSLHHHCPSGNNSRFHNNAFSPSSSASASAALEPGSVLLRLSVRAWDLRPGESLAVLGSAPSLGSWQTSRAVRMTAARRRETERREESKGGGDEPTPSSSSTPPPPPPHSSSQRPEPPLWELELAVPAAHFPVTYRFAVLGGGGGGRGSTSSVTSSGGGGGGGNGGGDPPPFGGPPLRLEAGENRIVSLDIPPPPPPPSSAAAATAAAAAPSPAPSPPTPTPPALSLVAADGGWLRPPDWRRWRGAGLAVPLFSVRSRRSLGVGGFADVAPLARWCAAAGLRVLQLLPLNDTRVTGDWRDSYPYATLSAFALHPLYCDVERGLLPEEEGEEGEGGESADGGDGEAAPPALPPRAAAAVRRLREELDPLDAVDYERVLEAKMEAARAVFDATGRAELGMPPLSSSPSSQNSPSSSPAPPAPSPSPSFVAFFDENAHWLRPHAAHRILATKVFGHPEHWRWGSLSRGAAEARKEGGGAAAAAAAAREADLSRVLSLGSEAEAGQESNTTSSSNTKHAFSAASADAKFEWWLQWKLHGQLLRASRAAARDHGVALKGDLPIGVDACGVDAWHRPELFRLGVGSTGAPPDAFDARGQAWGFPTYDWEAAAAEDYEWWRARLGRMARFFHALRIDHVLGFFRIWELEPGAVTGACGRFRPARPVSRRELLEGAGLWDIDRLTHPHISRELASAALAPAAAAAAAAAAASSSSSSSEAASSASSASLISAEVDFLIDGFLEPVPGVPGRLRLRAPVDSEAAIDALGRDEQEAEKVEKEEKSSAAYFEALRQGLLSLRQNVCLIEDPDLFDDGGGGEEEGGKVVEEGGGPSPLPPAAEAAAAAAKAGSSSPAPNRHPNASPLLHPRFNLTSTASFRELGPQGWRDALARLHDDYYYGDRHESQWAQHGSKTLLPLLDASNMLVCGEDLGLVPACAAGVLRSLGVLGLRVQRMPARGEGVAASGGSGGAAEFGDPALYPYLSVASPSTHDMPPLRAWWEGEGDDDDEGEEEDEERKQRRQQQQRLRERFWFAALGRSGPPPRRCTPDLVAAIVGSHAHSPAMLAVFALQDVLAMSAKAYYGGKGGKRGAENGGAAAAADDDDDDFSYSRPPPSPSAECINDPSVRRHYWRWRCHASVEEMERDAELTGSLRRLLESSGRDVGGRGRGAAAADVDAAAAAVARVGIR